ncbi:MAG TPA: sigma-70 family RNA polymerase sigma factor [Candidatus Hydrogenedentes bacterium]|nr:sigma-70 family RNA polymerase sigma factor [Candidatus Hydrogenedentota bacterium]HIJ75031.1 sigma-70 family RNA polymerase sigma factor [Candidatus Hydrogenedentota bacterium]
MSQDRRLIQSELLFLQYRKGGQQALAELIGLWERPLFYYVRRMVSSEEDAWDVLQDVWLRVVRSIGRVRKSGSLPAWLYKVAHNATMSHLRKVSRWEPLADDCDGQAVEPTAVTFSPDEAEEVHWALGKLKLRDRELLTLFFLEGFSLAEISEVVGAPVGTIKSRLHRAKKALRRILEEEKSP